MELEALPIFGRPYAIFLDVLFLLLIQCAYIPCATELPKITETASVLELSSCIALGRVLCLAEATHNGFFMADSK